MSAGMEGYPSAPKRQWEILHHSAVRVNHTGDTAETTLATVSIPANKMGPNGAVRITAITGNNSSGNNKTMRIKFGASDIYFASHTTNITQITERMVANRNAANSQLTGPLGADGTGRYTGAVVTLTKDTTAAVDIVVTVTLALAGDNFALESLLVELLHGD